MDSSTPPLAGCRVSKHPSLSQIRCHSNVSSDTILRLARRVGQVELRLATSLADGPQRWRSQSQELIAFIVGAAVGAVAQKPGIGTAETVRKWVRQLIIRYARRLAAWPVRSVRSARLRRARSQPVRDLPATPPCWSSPWL
jgi:hypothetical protein